MCVYVEGVDHARHREGPESTKVDKEIARVYATLQDLMRRAPSISTVVVSDHGMASIDSSRVIDVDSSIPLQSAMSVTRSPMLFLWNKSLYVSDLYSRMITNLSSPSHVKLFLRENVPLRWLLRSFSLVPPVVGLAEIGWSIKLDQARPNMESHPDIAVTTRKAANHPDKGNHGFDIIEPVASYFHRLRGVL